MNLRDLHYLIAVAENRNFKRAAQLCNVSQPTLSMQIKKLENYLGVRLFERTNKSVMITSAGQKIVDIARRIAQDEQHILDLARTAHDPQAGEFRLGAIPTLASYIFPAIAPTLATAFPKLQLLLAEDKTERLLERLRAAEIDAVLLALPVNDPALATAFLFEDVFFLATSQDHVLAKRKSVHIDDLSGHKLLLLDEGHCLRDQALDVCRAHGAYEEKSFRATSLETLRLMVQAPRSPFMTLMPRVARLPHDRLRYIPFRGSQPARRIGLAWRKTSVRAGMMAGLKKAMLAALA